MTVTPLFKKLNFKQNKEIPVLNHPAELKAEIDAMQGCTAIKTDIKNVTETEFVLTFITTKAEINAITPLMTRN